MSISRKLNRRKKHQFCLCHSSHEKFVLAEEFFGHGVVKFQKELVLAGNFGQKIFPSKFHGGVELGFAETVEAIDAKVFPVRGPSDWGFMSWDSSLASFDDPFEDSEVFSKAWPEKLAVRILAEPVHMKNTGESPNVFSHIKPMGKVVAHVVSAEWEHRHRIASDGTDGSAGRGGGL